MKTKNLYKSDLTQWSKVQFLIATLLVLSTSAFAQQNSDGNDNNQRALPSVQNIYEGKAVPSVYVTPEASAAMPSALLNDNMSEVSDADVSVWDNSSENHLLIMAVKTVRKDLSATVYNEKGERVMPETPIDPGTYRIVEHTHDLKPGEYVLNILERGIIIQKQKFTVK